MYLILFLAVDCILLNLIVFHLFDWILLYLTESDCILFFPLNSILFDLISSNLIVFDWIWDCIWNSIKYNQIQILYNYKIILEN
jgi:hypothetical protein